MLLFVVAILRYSYLFITTNVKFFSAAMLCGIACVVSMHGTAQVCTYVISGSVTDEQNHPIIGAVVLVEDAPALGSVTDTGGHFHISEACSGHTYVLCRADGFTTGRAHLHVTGNSTVHFTLHTNQLAEVVINDVRTPQELHTLSATSLKGLERFQAMGKSLGDALKDLPGLNAIQTGPNISKPVIHGLHSNRVLLMNNGVRQEGQQWGSEHAPEIDPFVANRITVVKGAASVRYGADAIGGVVLLDPDPLPATKQVSGGVSLIGQSNGRMGNAAATVQGKTGDKGIAWRVQGSTKKAGNFSTPNYLMKNTGVEELNMSAHAGYKRKRWEAEAYFSRFQSKNGIFEGAHAGNITDLLAAIGRSRPLTESVFSYDIARSYQATVHNLAKLSGIYHFANEGHLEAIAARQADLREEYDVSLPYTKDPTLLSKPQVSFQLITHSAELMYVQPSHNGFSGNVGIAGNTQGNVFRGIRYLIPNFRTYSGGAFVIERYQRGKFTYEAGARYDYRWQRVYQRNPNTLATYNTTLTFANPTATAGVIWKAAKRLSVSANVGSAWRAPSVNELYIHGVHFSDASYQDGDSTLKAERAWNMAATLHYHTARLRTTVDVYRNQIGNFIYETPQSQPVTLLSGTFPAFQFTQHHVTISGVDGSLQYDVVKHVTLQSRATIVRGYNNTTQQWLIYMPADRYENGVVFNLHQLGKLNEPYLSVENVTTLRQTRVPQNLDYAAPPAGYSIFNASIGFSMHVRKKKVQADITAANITNVAYRDYLDKMRYYTDNIGLNFIVKTRINF